MIPRLIICRMKRFRKPITLRTLLNLYSLSQKISILLKSLHIRQLQAKKKYRKISCEGAAALKAGLVSRPSSFGTALMRRRASHSAHAGRPAFGSISGQHSTSSSKLQPRPGQCATPAPPSPCKSARTLANCFPPKRMRERARLADAWVSCCGCCVLHITFVL